MAQQPELEQLKATLAELQILLRAEGVFQKHAFLFRRCFDLITWADTEPEAVEALKDYLSGMPNAPGTLRDLVIWRDAYQARKQINQRLDSLRERMFELAGNL